MFSFKIHNLHIFVIQTFNQSLKVELNLEVHMFAKFTKLHQNTGQLKSNLFSYICLHIQKKFY